MVEEEQKGSWQVTKSDTPNLSPNWVAEKSSGSTREALWGDQGQSDHGHSVSDNQGTRWSRGKDGNERD